MAFDGFTLYALREELKRELMDASLQKIVQSEKEELTLTFKTRNGKRMLYLSASPSLPMLRFTEETKPAPMNAPTFCMLLRKHLQGGRVSRIEQPSLERILRFTFEHRNDMGDTEFPSLIIELMGKHSNIILVNEKDEILDSIKRVPSHMSSVREVLPTRPYFIPVGEEKRNPLETVRGTFLSLLQGEQSLSDFLMKNFSGFSHRMASEVIYRSSLMQERSASSLSDEEKETLASAFFEVIGEFQTNPRPLLYRENSLPYDLSSIELQSLSDLESEEEDSFSTLLEAFYEEKARANRKKSSSSDLKRFLQTNYERCMRKLNLQEKQMKDTENRDKLRLMGELLTAWAYTLPEGESKAEVENYYDGSRMTIPLKKEESILENANRYFRQYEKKKRTYEALTEQLKESREEAEYLSSVLLNLDLAETEEELKGIREELISSGYLRRSRDRKEKAPKKLPPRRFLTASGLEILVGRNNLQNEEISFRLSSSDDWWFHASSMPGSHVILKTGGREPEDGDFEAAGEVAAYFSSGREQTKVEIDYVKRRELRKVNQSKPGFVIYHTHYSLIARPTLEHVTEIRDV